MKRIISLILLFVFISVNSSTATVYFQDSLESGVRATEQNGAGWGEGSNNDTSSNPGAIGGVVAVSTDTAHTGTHSLKFQYFAANYGVDGFSQQDYYLPGMTDVYIRYYVKFPSNYIVREDDGVTNNKIIEIWGDSYGTDTHLAGSESWAGSLATLGPTAYANDPTYTTLSYATTGTVYTHLMWYPSLGFSGWELTANDLNKWLCFEWHFKKDTGSGNGAMEFFVDGVRRWGGTSVQYAGAPTSGTFNNGYLFGWSNSGFAQDTAIYVDDFVISDTYIGPIAGGGGDTTAPTVSLTAPANGATLTGTVSLTATASDAGGMSRVEFYRGTTLLYSDTSSPYAYSWNTASVANGSYSITAKAYDTSNNTQTSSAASVTVSNVGSSTGSGGLYRAQLRAHMR